MKVKKKILLLSGHPKNAGGVVNFYLKLKDEYKNSNYDVKYFRVGRIQNYRLFNFSLVRDIDLVLNYIKFSYRIIKFKPSIIHINPSLGKRAIYRDFVFIILAKLISPKIKILLHIRGWDSTISQKLINRSLISWTIKYMANMSDAIIVLAKKFKFALQKIIEDSEKIYVIPTTANVLDFGQNNSINKNNKKINILFLSRLEEKKGIYYIARCVNPVIRKFPDLDIKFIFAGDGNELKKLVDYTRELKIEKHTSFTGYIRGEKKINLFLESDIFVFPTFHGEGCPNAVLEAMAAGLPIITTNVGALEDIIIDGENGIQIEKKSEIQIIHAISLLIENEKLRKKMSYNNRDKAMKEFDVPIIFKKIESIYDRLLRIEE
ncbi:MAG: glycosyltransferase [Candidatus Lokiarchaeota archaeon]|nr:glycosyltransferase [Candidatus Lokiarchaeota archaeon]